MMTGRSSTFNSYVQTHLSPSKMNGIFSQLWRSLSPTYLLLVAICLSPPPGQSKMEFLASPFIQYQCGTSNASLHNHLSCLYIINVYSTCIISSSWTFGNGGLEIKKRVSTYEIVVFFWFCNHLQSTKSILIQPFSQSNTPLVQQIFTLHWYNIPTMKNWMRSCCSYYNSCSNIDKNIGTQTLNNQISISITAAWLSTINLP